MKIKANNVEECATLFDIEVPKETLAKAFEEVYEEISKIASIPGFRQGKAPKELVKKHYAKNAKEEVLKRLIPEAYRRALEEKKVQPVGLPEITDVSLEEGSVLSFKARVDTHPAFKLKPYKGIRIEKKKFVPNDDDVNKTLENLRELNAKYIAVEDRSVQAGDYIVSDVECLVDNKPAHKKRENLWIVVEKDSFIPGLEEKIAGAKRGDEREIEAALPENYPDKNLAGKRCVYHIKVKEIKKRQLPALDDEFAKEFGKSSLDEIKKEVASELEARAKFNIEIEAENQLLKKLMDEYSFAVPSRLVKRQIDLMAENAKKRLQEKGFKREDLDKKDDEFRARFKFDAARQVRLLFILDEIASAEKIEATDADVETAYKSIAAQTRQDEKKVKEHYEKEDVVDNLKDKIREEKTIRFLLDNAQVAEKVA